MIQNVTVLGGGAMGTGCAVVLAERQSRGLTPGAQHITLWTRQPAHAADMAESRENRRLLPGVRIADSIHVTADAPPALQQADLCVVAVPTQFLRATLRPLAPFVPAQCPVVSVVKGLENGTFLRPSEILREIWGPRDLLTLCGPSHAEEFARRLPCSVVVAGDNLPLAQQVQTLFTTDRFRVYTNPDILGVELAAALKNVVAIAAGICDGLQYGDNAKAALLTRGIVEITRFGTMLGAEPETFAGLAGTGDLITTCFSKFGRNRRVGERLGQGVPLPQILAELTGVAEGIATCRSVYELSLAKQIDMPIITEIYRVLFEGKSPLQATDSLMQRPPRAEGCAH